jgi:hypothetical protein
MVANDYSRTCVHAFMRESSCGVKMNRQVGVKIILPILPHACSSETIDLNQQTAQDYSIEVTDPDTDATDPVCRCYEAFCFGCSFVRSFVRSLVRSFVCPSVRSLARSCVRAFVRAFVRSFVWSFVHSSVRSVGVANLCVAIDCTSTHCTQLCGYLFDLRYCSGGHGELWRGLTTNRNALHRTAPYLCTLARMAYGNAWRRVAYVWPTCIITQDEWYEFFKRFGDVLAVTVAIDNG